MALLELAQGVDGDAPSTLEALRAGLKAANGVQPQYSRVLDQHALLLPYGTLPLTVKGTVQRGKAVKLFAADLDAARRGEPSALQRRPSLGASALEANTVSSALPGVRIGAAIGAVVHALAHELVGSTVSADEPLMQAGLDSLGATEFHSRISQRLGQNIGEMPEMLIFDFPTLRQIETHLLRTAAADDHPPVGLLTVETVASAWPKGAPFVGAEASPCCQPTGPSC